MVLQDENTIHMTKTLSNIYTEKVEGRLQHARNDKVKNEAEIKALIHILYLTAIWMYKTLIGLIGTIWKVRAMNI